MNSFSRFFYHFARLVLGVIFIYASLDKISHPQAFAQAIFNYQILPDAFINLTLLRDLLFLVTAAYLFGITFFKKQSLTLERSLFKNE